MKVFKLICAAAFLLATVAAHAEASFEAMPTDVTLRALVGRWAQGEGKKFVWEAGGDAVIMDVMALNAYAKLHVATSFSQALDGLNRTLERANLTDPAKPLPLIACVFEDAIVIRRIDQPECGVPL